MEDNESVNSYDSIKNNPKSLNLLRNHYVHLELIQNRSADGFVHAIDPEGHSIILLEPRGENYQTILIPGHSILNLSVIDSTTNIKPEVKPIHKSTTDLVEKRKKLMSWFKKHQLSVLEKDDDIVLGSVLIMPPYDITSIYSTNLIVTKHVRDIVEKMPENYVED